ncbi:MAG TPA: alginate lyase family protein [Polyangiaceae bacterium]|nr:alginate lyase family protein [Polyangiaceae bacterium]
MNYRRWPSTRRPQPQRSVLASVTLGLLLACSGCGGGSTGDSGSAGGSATGGTNVGGQTAVGGSLGGSTPASGGVTSGGSAGVGANGGSSGGPGGSGGAANVGGAAVNGGTAGKGGSAGNGGSAGMSGGSSAGGAAGASGNGAGGSAGGGGGAAGAGGKSGAGMVHPGGLLTQRDLDRMRTNVAAGTAPYAAAWNAIRAADANANYQPSVAPTITVEHALQNQGHAAYVLAVKWAASGDMTYATAAKRVLDAWVNTVTNIASPQTTLRVGIGSVQMANAAELIAHGFNGSAGWPPAQVAKAKKWFSDVVWPRICAGNLQRSSNWGTSAMAGCMSIAVFSDERAKFDYAVNAYKYGFQDGPDGCSGVAQYICSPTGQATEAGRDQGHPQGGVAHLVEVALMAWHQGTDLVTYENNRVVAGMEYLAKYNLGNDDVPYDRNFPDPCNVHPSWQTISMVDRGKFSPVYASAKKLFTLAGVPHPFTTQVLMSAGYQPERTNSDHPGMGTLSMLE